MFPKVFKYGSQSLQMLLLGSGEYGDVVQIHKVCGEIQISKVTLHKMLKCHWGIAQSEQHTLTLEEPKHVYSECHVFLESSTMRVCQNPDN